MRDFVLTMLRSCLSGNCILSVCAISDTNILYSSIVRSLLVSSHKRPYSLNATNEKWDLMSAVCVERRPIITKPFTQLESKVYKLLNDIETERGHKSNHEMKRDLEKVAALAKEHDFDADNRTHQTTQDIEDAAKEEYNKFKFASRTTPADEKHDTKSLDRKLDRSLVLVIKEAFGKDLHWAFPQGVRQEGETMRQTAERVLKENCGDELKTFFLGNAPCGFYKYKYPKDIRKSSEIVGAKVFFFKAFCSGGNVKKGLCSDYQWLTQNELDILHQEYKKSIDMFLINDF